MRIFQRLDEIDGGQTTWRQSHIKLSDFYGIELADFAAETTKLSLWIAEYQMNQRFKNLFGEAPRNFPLREGGHIICGNALRLDWFKVCPLPLKSVQKEKVFDLARIVKVHATEEVPDEDAETYIVGNPPYLGGKIQNMLQKEDLRIAFAAWALNSKNFDYVSGWFVKAVTFLEQRPRASCAFVCTNSLNQGIHASNFWPHIFARGIEVTFAFRDFKWANSTSNNANVICSIIGISLAGLRPKKRYFYAGTMAEVANINSYLLPMPNYYVKKQSISISSLPRMYHGNTPIDDGNLLLTDSQKNALLDKYPSAAPLLRRVVGSKEFINGISRWCLWIDDDLLGQAKRIPEVMTRIGRVRDFRRKGGVSAVSCMDRPHQFFLTRTASESLLVVPKVSSEKRQYIPAGFADAQTIVTDLAYMVPDPPAFLLSIIISRMHITWLRLVGGRLKTDFRYSNTVVFNTFPLPALDSRQQRLLEEHAWAIVQARDSHPGRSLAWLYSADGMPEDLAAAHKALDETLERIYIGRPFRNDTERLEHLFKLYADMTSGKQKVAHA
jgi:hypothetical protein